MSKQDLYNYIASRRETCYFRFNEIFNARDKHFLQKSQLSTVKTPKTPR
jgi:hypothetical protein